MRWEGGGGVKAVLSCFSPTVYMAQRSEWCPPWLVAVVASDRCVDTLTVALTVGSSALHFVFDLLFVSIDASSSTGEF